MSAFPSARSNAVLAILAGLALIALAAPRFAAGVVKLPFDPVLAALGRGAAPSVQTLSAAARSRRAALGWHRDGRSWAELGALALARARAETGDPRARRAFLDQAIASFRNALSLAPAQPFAWTHYAQAVLARDGAVATLGPLLRLSAATAPFEPRIVRQRIEIGLLAGAGLPGDARALIVRDIRHTAEQAPDALARLARRRNALGAVRGVLTGSPGLLRRFDRAYLAQSRP